MNRIQQIKSPNKLEIAGYAILDSINIEYKKQFIINDKFTVDAYIPVKKIVLQFDGDYWHGNPEKFTTLNKHQRKRRTLDIWQDAYMTKCGYRIIRWWEHEIHDNPQQCKKELLQMIK